MHRLTTATERAQAKIIGRVLRQVREDAGLSLHAVEALSDRTVKASLLGSYERGERMVSVDRLLDLADLYSVAPGVLLSVIERRVQHPALTGVAVGLEDEVAAATMPRPAASPPAS